MDKRRWGIQVCPGTFIEQQGITNYYDRHVGRVESNHIPKE